MTYAYQTTVDDKLAPLLDLPKFLLGKKVEIVVKLMTEDKEHIRKMRRESRGSMKNEIWMADDFNAPLEEMKEYM